MSDETVKLNYQGDLLAGVDEVGRGPLAGPVVAAAVILKEPIDGLTDSKKISEKKRNLLAQEIKQKALCYAIVRVSHQEIDRLNILNATMLAMQRAIAELTIKPEFAAIDGNKIPHLPIPAQAVIKGDSKVAAISAASILAKVSRDNEMIELDSRYPQYGFAKHKGYPTKVHVEALRQHGPCPVHRLSFAPVNACLEEDTIPA